MPDVGKVARALGKTAVAVVLAGPLAGAKEAANSAIDLFWTDRKRGDPLTGLADNVAMALQQLAASERLPEDVVGWVVEAASNVLAEHGLTAAEFTAMALDPVRAVQAVCSRAQLSEFSEDEEALFRRAILLTYQTIVGKSATLPELVAAYQRQTLSELRGLGRSAAESRTAQRREVHAQLVDPSLRWDRDLYPSSSLLRAEYGVVPFGGRTDLLTELASWASGPHEVALRLFTGAGGMGKTRLLIKLCRVLRDQGWRTGFVPATAGPLDAGVLSELGAGVPGVLVVVDYAETRLAAVAQLVAEALAAGRHVRIVLLARSVANWWYELRQLRNHVGDFLDGPRTTSYALPPLAQTAEERAEVYLAAFEAFAATLDRSPSGVPRPQLAGDDYDRVLFLHMSALAAVNGEPVASSDGLLDLTLRREQGFWDAGLAAVGLEALSGQPVRQAAALATLVGSARDHGEATAMLRRVPLLDGQPVAVVARLAELLHRLYPGDTWLGGVQPDLLGEYLVGTVLADTPELLEALDGA